jgi:hypothetical protein
MPCPPTRWCRSRSWTTPAHTLGGYFAAVDAFADRFGREVDPVDDRLVVNPYRRRSIHATRRRIFPAPCAGSDEPPPATEDRIPALLLDARQSLNDLIVELERLRGELTDE